MSTASASSLSSPGSRPVTLALAGAALATVIAMSPCAAWAGGPRIVSDGEAPAQAPPESSVEATVTPTPVVAVDEGMPQALDLRAFELGLSGVMLYSGDDHIVDEALYGGLSWFMRYRIEQWWSLTFGFDLVSRGSDAVGELRVGGDLGGHIYFTEDSIWQPFASVGLALASSSVLDHRGADGAETSYGELGGYAGVGLDVVLDDWLFTTQVRALCMSRMDAEEPPPRDDYVRRAADVRGLLHWSVGAGYRF